MNFKCLLVLIFWMMIVIIFIIQCIHFSNGQFSSKELKDKINNWKLNPIIDISLSSTEKGFSEKDFIFFYSTKIYLKRLKNYNYPKLKVQEKKLINSKVCGIDQSGEEILFPKYMPCPINYIEINSICNSGLTEKCIELGDKYIVYSNSYIKNKLLVNISYDVEIGYTGLNSYEKISEDFEKILSIPKKLKIKNIFGFIFCLFLIPFIIRTIIVILQSFSDNDFEDDIFSNDFFIVYIFISSGLFICNICGVVWIKQGTDILNSLELTDCLMKKSVFNSEIVNLLFSFIFAVTFYFSSIQSSYKEKWKEFLLILFFVLICGGILIGTLLIPIIFLIINLSQNPFNNGFIKDLKLNYQMSPITQIDVSTVSTISDKMESSYFDPKVPYKLGTIIKKNSDDETEEYINSWKGNYFYVTRMNSDFTYPKLFSIYDKKNKDRKLCGLDSNGNKIYFPLNEYCPINYIEFTSSPKPSLKEDYKWITKQLDSNTYIHYTHDKTDGEILVHFRVSVHKPMADINSYNEICYKLYGIDNCKEDNNYEGYDDDVYGYQQIDSSDSSFIDPSTSENIYLYKRTYSGLNKYNSNNNIGEEIFGIKSFIQNSHIVSIIFYIISLSLIIILLYLINKNESEYYKSYFQISLIASILSFIALILVCMILSRVKKIKDNIFDNSNYDIKYDFINYPLFYKLDIGVLVYIIIIFILGTIFSIFFIADGKSMFTHEFTSLISNFFTDNNYLTVIIFLLFILLTLLIVFPTLLLFYDVYDEGYVKTVKKNWEKVPITGININTGKEAQLGTFNNFPDEKPIDIYNWRNVSFSFTRKIGNYFYTKIRKNKVSGKLCGKDNAGNDLYFKNTEDCPINYVSIGTSKPTLNGVNNIYNIRQQLLSFLFQ